MARRLPRLSVWLIGLALTVIAISQFSTGAAQEPSPEPPTVTPTPSKQVLVVTKLADTDDGRCDARDCSLREAIQDASWGATITFAPRLKGTIKLTDGLLIRKSLNFKGPGPKSGVIVISGGKQSPIFLIRANVVITVSLLTFADGFFGRGGAISGDIATLRISDSTFIGNTGGFTGAIGSLGDAIIANCTFVNNEAAGGVISNGGTMQIINSTFKSNKGGVANSGQLTIISSTFLDNSFDASATLSSGSTVAQTPPVLTIKNSIIQWSPNPANPIMRNCKGSGIVDGGNNLQFPNAQCSPTIPVGDPKLGKLADNGGSTFTLKPLAGSAAIGKVPDADCLPKDQRGVPHKAGTPCNIGAVQS